MRFWIEQPEKKQLYTAKLISHLIREYGHEEKLADDSVILASLCDVTELPWLGKLRQKYPKNRIISGGHFSKIGANAMLLHSDLVWVGHIFTLLKCKTYDEVLTCGAAYAKLGQGCKADYEIEWSKCPAIQVDPKRFYLWGGVGCKNKCKFCLTSWTEPHEARPNIEQVVCKAKRQIGKKGSLKVISNAYSDKLGDDLVQDMLLRDMLKIRDNKKRKLIRCGVEFATEEMRKKNGKPISDIEITSAINHAREMNFELQMFMIGGLSTWAEWMSFIELIPEGDDMKPRIFIKFTNLEYQQKTPLWQECQSANFGNYLTTQFSKDFFATAAHKNKRVRVLPAKYPAHAIWRMIASNVRTHGEYNAAMKLKNNENLGEITQAFIAMAPWKNDISNIKTYWE
jgi:hypothetical protein